MAIALTSREKCVSRPDCRSLTRSRTIPIRTRKTTILQRFSTVPERLRGVLGCLGAATKAPPSYRYALMDRVSANRQSYRRGQALGFTVAELFTLLLFLLLLILAAVEQHEKSAARAAQRNSDRVQK